MAATRTCDTAKRFIFFVLLVVLCTTELFFVCYGFCSIRRSTLLPPRAGRTLHPTYSTWIPKEIAPIKPKASWCALHFSNNEENEGAEAAQEADVPVIVRGSDEDELSDEIWENVETGQPPEWVVVKELLGINIFTYILAAAITFFLASNYFMGPGWLGQALGWKGAGTYTEVSQSLPDSLDLNSPDFLLE